MCLRSGSLWHQSVWWSGRTSGAKTKRSRTTWPLLCVDLSNHDDSRRGSVHVGTGTEGLTWVDDKIQTQEALSSTEAAQTSLQPSAHLIWVSFSSPSRINSYSVLTYEETELNKLQPITDSSIFSGAFIWFVRRACVWVSVYSCSERPHPNDMSHNFNGNGHFLHLIFTEKNI